jgi:hypothetical protein
VVTGGLVSILFFLTSSSLNKLQSKGLQECLIPFRHYIQRPQKTSFLLQQPIASHRSRHSIHRDFSVAIFQKAQSNMGTSFCPTGGKESVMEGKYS